MADETWRPVTGYEGLYEVSDHGRVRSVDRTVTFANGWTRDYSSQIISPSKRVYWRVTLRDETGRRRTWKLHTLVLAAFVGPRPEGSEGRHLDDNKDDNRLSNLAYGTRSQNRADSVRNGTHREARKTHCPKGHPYEGDNLFVMPNGNRRCVTCARESGRAQWEKRKGERNAARRNTK